MRQPRIHNSTSGKGLFKFNLKTLCKVLIDYAVLRFRTKCHDINNNLNFKLNPTEYRENK